ncbi:MAG: sigma-70 family RNA polymerase sigma factor [Fuerstiella sp.]
MAETPDSFTGHEAFLRLFTRFEGNLRAFVASLLPTWDGVDDVMQESSVVLWRKFAEFDQSGADSDFLVWAFPIARYEVLKYRRRRATDRLQFSKDVFELLAAEAEHTCATQTARQLALRECVRKLEPSQLALVKAVYEDGAAIRDVADQIGRSTTGLYKALARIRDRLASCVRTGLDAGVEGLS